MDPYDLEQLFEGQDEPGTPHPKPPRTLRPANNVPKSPVRPANEHVPAQDSPDDDQTPSLSGILHSQLLELDQLRYDLARLHGPLVRAQFERRMVLGEHPDEKDKHIGPHLKEARKAVGAIQSKVDQMHANLRHLANKESRRRVRKLHLLDLPDEVLREICGYFGPESGSRSIYYFPDYYRRELRQNIANIRLTCRRLCEASSHLLLSETLLLLEPTSISETQAVSSHPLISKGLQCLYVDLDFYRANYAESLATFAQQILSDWEQTLEYQGRVIAPGRWELWGKEMSTCSRRDVARAVKKGERLSREWATFIEGLQALDAGSVEMHDFVKEAMDKSKAIAGIVRAHERFNEHYGFQQSLLRDGSLVRIIVDTLQKMPALKRLHIETEGRLSGRFWPWKNIAQDYKPFQAWVDDPHCVARHFGIRRRRWRGTDAGLNDDLPAETCLDIMTGVFGNNDLCLDHLSLTLPISSLLEYATEERLQVLREGTRRMRVFEYSHSSDVDPRPDDLEIFEDADRMRKTTDLLLACMGGPCLRRLDLHPPHPDPDDDPRELGMGRLLSHVPFPLLEYVALNDFHFHLRELERFLEPLAVDKVHFSFKDVTLLSGTWAEAIDLIKAKSGPDSSISDLRGAELDDFTDEEYEAFFEDSFSVKYERRQREARGETLGRPEWERPEDNIIPIGLYINLPNDYAVGKVENPFRLRARCLEAMEADDAPPFPVNGLVG